MHSIWHRLCKKRTIWSWRSRLKELHFQKWNGSSKSRLSAYFGLQFRLKKNRKRWNNWYNALNLLILYPCIIFCRDNKELVATIKIKMVSKEDTHILSVSNVTKKTTGVYKVVAKNKFGQVEHTAKITVTGSFTECMSFAFMTTI